MGDIPGPKAYALDDHIARELAELAQSNSFFASVYDSYRRYGTVTKRQYLALLRELDDGFRVNGVAVVNRFIYRNRVLCFRCSEYATTVVGRVAVCDTHVKAQKKANVAYAKVALPLDPA